MRPLPSLKRSTGLFSLGTGRKTRRVLLGRKSVRLD
jgi:hypothetical protein